MKVIKEGQGRQPNPAGALPSRLQSKPDSSSLRSPAFTPLRRQETNDQRKGYNAARATGPNAVCQRPSANSTWRPAITSNPAQGFKHFKHDHVPPTPNNQQAATGPSAHLWRPGVCPAHSEDQQTPRALTSVSGPPCPPSLQGSPLTTSKKSTISVTSTKLASNLQPGSA